MAAYVTGEMRASSTRTSACCCSSFPVRARHAQRLRKSFSALSHGRPSRSTRCGSTISSLSLLLLRILLCVSSDGMMG